VLGPGLRRVKPLKSLCGAMIPRTVNMAAAVAAQFTPTELEDYGNIILNGYNTTVPNTTNVKAWQYKETSGAPVDLPDLVESRPAFKGWTTNYMQYYTELPVNAYSQVPGNPTMFDYTVHSFTPQNGPIKTLSWVTPGTGYTPGTYTGVALTGGSGASATANIVVEPDPDPLVVGRVKSVILVNPGTGYEQNDSLSAVIPGGTGFSVLVYSIVPDPATGGAPRWSQSPQRLFQLQVSSVTPPQYVNNREVIQYSFIHPVADNPVSPPIGGL